MKINPLRTYSIKLLKEPCVRKDHKKSPNGILEFTGKDLIAAIISEGMPNIYLTRSAIKARRPEIDFKKNLFESFVDASATGELSFDLSKRKYLDGTEIGAINYWIGMILVTVLGQKKYGYEFMVHLSKIRLFRPQISLTKNILSITTAKGKPAVRYPDLVAVNLHKKMYGVFESKGYSRYSGTTMEHAHEQAKIVNTINGNSPTNCLAVMTLTGDKKPSKISMIEKDPEGDELDIIVDPNLLYLYHFLPIAELIKELGPVDHGDRIRGSLRYEDECYSISLPMALYRELSKITESNENPFSDESFSEGFFSEEHFSHLMLEKSEGRILRVE